MSSIATRPQSVSVFSRRTFLGGVGAALTAPCFGPFSRLAAATETVPSRSESDAVKAMRALVGEKPLEELLVRLRTTNSDIKHKGLKTIAGVPDQGGTFLTGYPYTEFYRSLPPGQADNC